MSSRFLVPKPPSTVTAVVTESTITILGSSIDVQHFDSFQFTISNKNNPNEDLNESNFSSERSGNVTVENLTPGSVYWVNVSLLVGSRTTCSDQHGTSRFRRSSNDLQMGDVQSFVMCTG